MDYFESCYQLRERLVELHVGSRRFKGSQLFSLIHITLSLTIKERWFREQCSSSFLILFTRC